MPKFLPVLTAVFAAALAALTLGVSSAAAAPTPCWKTLLNDYFRDGRIDQTYQLKCYNQALSHLDEDTLIYGSARRRLQRAPARAGLGLHPKHPRAGSASSPAPNSVRLQPYFVRSL